MPLSFSFWRSRLFNRRSNHQASPVLRLWVAFSSTSRSPSEPSAADIGGYPATIREGRAEIFADESNSVFYNKVQVNNRDISIAVLRSFVLKRREEHATRMTKGGLKDNSLSEHAKYKAPRILEALAASGLRSIRYALEVDGVGEVIAVDNNEVAIEACKKNIQHNSSLASSKVVPHLADARVYMLTHLKEFDVVDLDPYGSPAMFLDSAVQCVADGGMLMCSATDMAVLAGGNADVCFSKYGSYPLRGKHCHEMALRILLACIEDFPLILVSHNKSYQCASFICSSASIVKSSPLKLSHVYQCIGCGSFHLQTIGRIKSKELPDAPLFVSLHNLCATLKCTAPTMGMLYSAIRNAGYKISGSHVDPLALKTDAPVSAIWDIMRCWVKLHPVKHRPGNHPGNIILSQEPKLQANFSQVPQLSVRQKSPRFVPNPEKYWGPKPKAGRHPKICHSGQNS